MNTANRALRFVNLLPLPTSSKAAGKPALTSSQEPVKAQVHAPVEARPEVDEQTMARRRAEALRGFFPKVFTWFASRWDLVGMSEVNHYLSMATDAADLEQRIRRLERRRHFGSF